MLNLIFGLLLGLMYATLHLPVASVLVNLLIIVGVGVVLRPLLAKNSDDPLLTKVLDGAAGQMPLVAFTWFAFLLFSVVLPHLR